MSRSEVLFQRPIYYSVERDSTLNGRESLMSSTREGRVRIVYIGRSITFSSAKSVDYLQP